MEAIVSELDSLMVAYHICAIQLTRRAAFLYDPLWFQQCISLEKFTSVHGNERPTLSDMLMETHFPSDERLQRILRAFKETTIPGEVNEDERKKKFMQWKIGVDALLFLVYPTEENLKSFVTQSAQNFLLHLLQLLIPSACEYYDSLYRGSNLETRSSSGNADRASSHSSPRLTWSVGHGKVPVALYLEAQSFVE